MKEKKPTLAEAMADRIQRDIERAFFAEVTGGATNTTTAWEDQPPLTIERIQAVIDAMPPRETWVVSRLFPQNGAAIAKTPGENFTCINDVTWMRLQPELRRTTPPEHRGNPFYEIRPVFIDPDTLDEPHHAAWRAKEAHRIMGTIGATVTASVELKRVMDAWWRRL